MEITRPNRVGFGAALAAAAAAALFILPLSGCSGGSTGQSGIARPSLSQTVPQQTSPVSGTASDPLAAAGLGEQTITPTDLGDGVVSDLAFDTGTQESDTDDPSGIVADPVDDYDDFGDSGSGSGRATAPLPRRGVQAVLLSSWSDTSVANFITACQNSGTTRDLEIAFEPFLKAPAGGSDRYAHVKTIINALKPTNRIVVAVHFGFHAGGNLEGDKPTGDELKRRASEFVTKLYELYKDDDRVSFVVVPSLEDGWAKRADFDTKAKILLDALYANLPTDTKGNALRLSVRRSSIVKGFTTTASLTVSGKVNGKTVKKVVKIRKEIHGKITGGYAAYSNDGDFVWFDNAAANAKLTTESAQSAFNPYLSLSDFCKGVKNKTYSVLLWRPAYNLFDKSGATYTKPLIADRTDGDKGAAKFDKNEAAALVQFLKGS